MNTKTTIVFVLCAMSAISSFAQGWGKLPKVSKLPTQQLSSQITRSVQLAKPQKWVRKVSLPTVVNGYLRTPNVIHFKVAGVPMRAVQFSRDIWVQKENLYIPEGSLAVIGPEKEISVYTQDDPLPQEIKAGLDAAFEEKYPGLLEFAASNEVLLNDASAAPWTGKLVYEHQEGIGLDVDAYYQGQAEEVVVNRISKYKAKVYRVPSSNIYYQPAGRCLNPDRDLILFSFAKQDGTPIADGQIIFDGLTDDTWRMFFEPIQQ